MRFIGSELGRLIVLITSEEWSPTKLSTLDAFNLIKERYEFAYAPNLSIPWEKVQQDGFKFQVGKIKVGGIEKPINDLTFFTDGIVINAKDTDDAEALFDDISIWSIEVLGTNPVKKFNRRFYSQIIVEFEQPVNNFVSKFDEISELLRKVYKNNYYFELPSIELRSLAFHYDILEVPTWVNIAPFSIDRRIGHRYEANRFLCEAPVKSKDHILLLSTIEQILSK